MEHHGAITILNSFYGAKYSCCSILYEITPNLQIAGVYTTNNKWAAHFSGNLYKLGAFRPGERMLIFDQLLLFNIVNQL